MLIKKGTLLKIISTRKGTYQAKATRDFDTEKEEWYPVEAAELVYGASQDWEIGDDIPCRASFCSVSIVEDSKT